MVGVTSRGISLSTHAVIEILAAPVLMAAPFFLGFGVTAGAAALVLGTMLMGLAISLATEERSMPLSTHAAFDYTFGVLTILAGAGLGLATDNPTATLFMVGFGAAHMALTASTRYSARGA